PSFPSLPTEEQRSVLEQQLGIGAVAPPSLEAVAATAANLRTKRDPAAHLELGEDARRALEDSIRRPGIFAPERRALEQQLGTTAKGALALNREELAKFRDVFAVVVGRVLPPELRGVYAPLMAAKLHELDGALYGDKSKAKKLPDLDLPTSDRL